MKKKHIPIIFVLAALLGTGSASADALCGRLAFYKQTATGITELTRAGAEGGTTGQIRAYLPLAEDESAFLALAAYSEDGTLLRVHTDRAAKSDTQKILTADAEIASGEKLRSFVFDGDDLITPVPVSQSSPITTAYSDAHTIILAIDQSVLGGSCTVYRNGIPVGTASSGRFIDNYLASDTVYAYTVRAEDGTTAAATALTDTALTSEFGENGAVGKLAFVDNHTLNTSDSYTENAQIGGRFCRRSILIPKADGAMRPGLFYFSARRSYIPTTENDVTFEVTYFDNGTNSINIEYNSSNGNIAKPALLAKRTGTNTWKTARLSVTDAAFSAPAALQSSDFRISGGADTYISRVRVDATHSIGKMPAYADLSDRDYPELYGISLSDGSFAVADGILAGSEDTVITVRAPGAANAECNIGGAAAEMVRYMPGGFTLITDADISGGISVRLTDADGAELSDALTYIGVGSLTPQYASADFTGGDVREYGMTFSLAEGDATTEAAEIGGRKCRRADFDSALKKQRYFYFNIDDSYAYGERDGEITVTADYFDSGTATLNVQYNSVYGDYTSLPLVTMTDTKTWKTASVTLRKASLRNLQNRSNDLRIGGINEAFYLSAVSIAVKKSTAPGRSFPQIFLASDSTCEDLPAVYEPREGWGMEIGGFFDSRVQIVNKAKGGKSSRTFLNGMDPTAVPVIENDGRLEDILSRAEPGDYLFIQFGHNDRPTTRPTQRTDPDSTARDETSYRYNLERFVKIARENGIIPIFITSIHERKFVGNTDTLAEDGIEPYRQAMREVGAAFGVPVLDIAPAHKALVERWGNEGSKKLFIHITKEEYPNYPANLPDDTHICKTGATEVARLVAAAIKDGAAKSSELAALSKFLDPAADLTPTEP